MVESDDALIRTLYSLATLHESTEVRELLLRAFRTHHGAPVAAWLTQGQTGVSGEFTVEPDEGSLTPLHLIGGASEAASLPRVSGLMHPLIVTYRHPVGHLTSIIALWFAGPSSPDDIGRVERGVSHLVAADSLGQQLYVQRDEWLMSLGRTNRGSTALIDASGVVHTASPQFRSLVAQVYGDPDFDRLPIPLPGDIERNTRFGDRELRFRLEPHGQLFTLYARRALPLDDLSPREQEIARALGEGKTFKSVARDKGIAVSTVANHASRIYRKLGIYRREDLVEIVRAPRGATPSSP